MLCQLVLVDGGAITFSRVQTDFGKCAAAPLACGASAASGVRQRIQVNLQICCHCVLKVNEAYH